MIIYKLKQTSSSQTLLQLTHIEPQLPGSSLSLSAASPVLLGVCVYLLCFACVRTEQEEIKAALSVCLQPTLLKRIAVEDEEEEA